MDVSGVSGMEGGRGVIYKKREKKGNTTLIHCLSPLGGWLRGKRKGFRSPHVRNGRGGSEEEKLIIASGHISPFHVTPSSLLYSVYLFLFFEGKRGGRTDAFLLGQ